MKPIRLALLAPTLLLTACSFEMEQPRNTSQVGRFQLVGGEGRSTVLLNTATGETWTLQGDVWRRCDGGPDTAGDRG